MIEYLGNKVLCAATADKYDTPYYAICADNVSDIVGLVKQLNDSIRDGKPMAELIYDDLYEVVGLEGSDQMCVFRYRHKATTTRTVLALPLCRKYNLEWFVRWHRKDNVNYLLQCEWQPVMEKFDWMLFGMKFMLSRRIWLVRDMDDQHVIKALCDERSAQEYCRSNRAYCEHTELEDAV